MYLINVEGLGKQIYPKLDFWSIADPFLQTWITERYDPSKVREWAQTNAIQWIEKARKFPEKAESALEQLNKLEIYSKENEKRHAELISRIVKEQRTVNISLLLIIVLALSYWFFG